MLSTAALLFVALAPGDDPPTFDLLSASRWSGARSYGADLEFEGGVQLRDFSPHMSGEWTSDLDAELDDEKGVPVARGASYHESDVGTRSLGFTLDAWAETTGLHALAEAHGESVYQVSFAVHVPVVRYAVRAGADAVLGADTALVRLDGPAGAQFALTPEPGSALSVQTTGWMPAGVYTLRGHVDASVFGAFSAPAAKAGNAECELSIHAAGDFQLDGDVDFEDRHAFAAAYTAGAIAADFDGDGRVEPEDREAFERVWSGSSR